MQTSGVRQAHPGFGGAEVGHMVRPPSTRSPDMTTRLREFPALTHAEAFRRSNRGMSDMDATHAESPRPVSAAPAPRPAGILDRR